MSYEDDFENESEETADEIEDLDEPAVRTNLSGIPKPPKLNTPRPTVVPLHPKGRDRVAITVKIQNLDFYSEVRQKLIQGDTCWSVAEFIHNTKKSLTDVPIATVERGLAEIRAKIPPGEVVSYNNPRVYHHALEKFEQKLDGCAVLQKAMEVQLDRVLEMREIEKRTKIPLQMLGKEMLTLKELASSFEQTKLDTGIGKRDLGSAQIDVRAQLVGKHGAVVAAVMADPGSRRRLLGMLNNSLALANKTSAPESEVEILPKEET